MRKIYIYDPTFRSNSLIRNVRRQPLETVLKKGFPVEKHTNTTSARDRQLYVEDMSDLRHLHVGLLP